MTDWTKYYDATGDDPRATLLDALDRFVQPGLAVDLGSGTGRDTAELVRASERLTCFTRTEAEALLSGLSVELIDEEERDSKDALGNPKHWHVFHIVARKDD